jgi:hypothetical protein
MERAKAKQGVQDLVIQLRRGSFALKSTHTNQFGEFEFQFDVGSNFYISIRPADRQPIILPLFGIYAPESGLA